MKRVKQVMIVALLSALASCASMAPASPEDRQEIYDAEPVAVEQAIRDYAFDYELRIINEGDGYLQVERPETSFAAGVVAGDRGGLTYFTDFQWRETKQGTQLRANMYGEFGDGRRAESQRVQYEQLFSLIRDYINN